MLLLEKVRHMLVLDGGRAVRYLVDQIEALGYRWAYRLRGGAISRRSSDRTCWEVGTPPPQHRRIGDPSPSHLLAARGVGHP